MTETFGHNVLSVFDVWEDSRDFLSQVIESRTAPDQETRRLFDQSLTGGAEDWNYLIDCARSIQQARYHEESSLDGSDTLTYVWHIFEGSHLAESPEAWQETDRLITLAKHLEDNAEIVSPVAATGDHHVTREKSVPPPAKKKQCLAVSHYWSNDPAKQHVNGEEGGGTKGSATMSTCHGHSSQPRNPAVWCQKTGKERPIAAASTAASSSQPLTTHTFDDFTSAVISVPYSEPSIDGTTHETIVRNKQSGTSPYFALPTASQKKSPLKRPPRGTVSCVPFPPLTSPSFGLVQEKVAHDPFWLLIAITFLIRTTGKHAIPVFYKVKERFPTPSHLADPSNEEELVGMIRHLGLSAVRVSYLQRYAKAFLETAPAPGIRYRVKNYDQRDVSPPPTDVDNLQDSTMSQQAPAVNNGDPEAWEIGHMTKGKYAIDSWRIFCRDELLGRAQDWNGKGREAEFQPEWMRVMPDDKELRAYLRWMWMREGWEWDPLTGGRTVVRDEMQRAANEGRVEYDDTGGLRIVEEPRSI